MTKRPTAPSANERGASAKARASPLTTRIWFALASVAVWMKYWRPSPSVTRHSPAAETFSIFAAVSASAAEPAEGDRGQVDAVREVDDAARARGLEPCHPVARQGDLVEERAQPGRAVQRGDRGRARRRVEREEGVAGDPFEADRLVVDDAVRVDHEDDAAGEVGVRMEEREVRLERRDAVELRVAEAATDLEHEVRRAGGDVAELDDLDRPGRVEREARYVVIDDVHLADLEGDLAADLEDRLVGEAEGLEEHPAGDVDEEDAVRSRVGLGRDVRARQLVDHLEGRGAADAEVALVVGP